MATINQTYFFKGITPVEVYEAYMNGNQQSIFTGSSCCMTDKLGGKCIMYGGYIEAENVKLELGELIEQKWVAHEDGWPENHESQISIHLKDKDGGTELTLLHTKVPDNLKESFDTGWVEHYWDKMSQFFS